MTHTHDDDQKRTRATNKVMTHAYVTIPLAITLAVIALGFVYGALNGTLC